MKPNRSEPLAQPDYSNDEWTGADEAAADAEGWNIFDSGGRLEIIRNDVNFDANATWFKFDEDAFAHVATRALQGSELHVRALKIHQKYADRDRYLVFCNDQRVSVWQELTEALWGAFQASESSGDRCEIRFNGELKALVNAESTRRACQSEKPS